jgi:hypothetical protein
MLQKTQHAHKRRVNPRAGGIKGLQPFNLLLHADRVIIAPRYEDAGEIDLVEHGTQNREPPGCAELGLRNRPLRGLACRLHLWSPSLSPPALIQVRFMRV